MNETPSTQETQRHISAAETPAAESSAASTQEMPVPASMMDDVKQLWSYLLRLLGQIHIPHLLMRLAGAFLLTSAGLAWYHNGLSASHVYRPIAQWDLFRDAVSPLRLIAMTLGIFLLCSYWRIKYPRSRMDSFLLLGGLIAFSLVTLWRSENVYYAFGMILITAVLGYLGLQYDRGRPLPYHAYLSRIPTLVPVLAAMCFAAGCVSVGTVLLYKINGTSCFDMGIFKQMYYSMVHDLSLTTTCERNRVLSHFAVHCSPIFYVLLPFYYLYPHAETLLVAQSLGIALGVLPLWGICRARKLGAIETIGFAFTYLFCVELIAPCFYPIHENAFLPPLLMLLFYAIERKRTLLIYFASALTLMVKEDAPVYIVCIGLFLLCQKDFGKKRLHGLALAVAAAVYFVVVTTLIGKYGEGVMTSRTYGNLMLDHDAGFGELLKTVLLNPAYLISQILRESNLRFFLIVMVPLALMPFITKELSALLLIVPFLLMNLASGYVYAADYNYQYVFGTTTCLIYAALRNVCALQPRTRRRLAGYMGVSTVYLSVALCSGMIVGKIEDYQRDGARLRQMDAVFASIPEDASVLCNTWYVPKLANRAEVYMMDEQLATGTLFTDYVIVRDDYAEPYDAQLEENLRAANYLLYDCVSGYCRVFVSPNGTP